MQHFQSVLIVVGVLAIASVLVHGYMLNRKEKAAALESKPELDDKIGSTNSDSDKEDDENDFSLSNQNDDNDEDYIDFSDALADEKEVVFLEQDEPHKTSKEVKKDSLDDMFSSETLKNKINSFSFKKAKNTENKKSKDEVVAEETNEAGVIETELEKVTDQVTENFEKLEQKLESKEEVEQQQKQPETEFFILHVMTKEGNTIGGLQLLQFFLTSGFRHGEMSLFHRHLEPDGTGPIMFSIANTLAPGTFDSGEMEKFTTEGVSFFINAPKPGVDMKAAFDMMFTAVSQLSEEFDCDILNENREPFTEQDFRGYEKRLMRYL